MQHQQTNKDLPANPVQFMDKFSNQMIILAGFTKQEAVALELFKSFVHSQAQNDRIDFENLIRISFYWSSEFCKYLEKQNEKDSTII